MRKLFPLLMLLFCLAGCGQYTDDFTAAPQDTPNSARTDFEVLGRVEQAEQEFLVLTLCLYEASGEPSGDPQPLAAVDPDSYAPGYEVRAIQLPDEAAFYRLENGSLTAASVWDIEAGDLVGVTAAGTAMSIVIYE